MSFSFQKWHRSVGDMMMVVAVSQCFHDLKSGRMSDTVEYFNHPFTKMLKSSSSTVVLQIESSSIAAMTASNRTRIFCLKLFKYFDNFPH